MSTSPPPYPTTPIEIACANWQEFINFHRVNIGAGGMFVTTEHPLPKETPMRVNLILPEDHGVVVLPAFVARCLTAAEAQKIGRQPGMGVAFKPPTSSLKRHIDALLEVARTSLASRDFPVVLPDSRPQTTSQSGPIKPTPSQIGDPDFFDTITEGHTGKVSISSEVTFAAVTRHMNESDFDGAKAELRGIFATEPDNLRARILWLVIEAREHLAEGRKKQARAKYQQVLQLDRSHGESTREIDQPDRSSQGLMGKLFNR